MSIWKWCLEKDDKTLATGWNQIGDYWYFMNPNGSMATSWVQANGYWYYLNESGQMKTGWIQDKDIWYYLEPNSTGNKGAMYLNGTYTIDNKPYTFDTKGAWIETQSLVSDEGINFIKSFEGFSATKYDDGTGVMTQGYGMTGYEISNLPYTISEEAASNMLKDLVNNKYANVIKSDLDSKNMALNQNEFDALVSFSYNCGTSSLLGSTLYKNVINGIKDSDTITSNFQAWSNGGGQRMEGLYRRRTKESNMFLNSDYTGNV